MVPYEVITRSVGGSGLGLGCRSGLRSGTYEAMTPQCRRAMVKVVLLEVSGSGPDCQSGYRSSDL